jgi:GNAT superfamily N-acetyltransferase
MLRRLREAITTDIPAIFRVRYAVVENTLLLGAIDDCEVQLQIEQSGRGWVVESEGSVVAFAIGNASNGNLWALFVLPDYEGLGYGTLLHNATVQWLWSRRLEVLWLTTGERTRARAFYETLGWRCMGLAAHGQVRMELLRVA